MDHLDKKAKQHHGYLYLRTNEGFYTSGDHVTGTIFIRNERDLPECKVKIQVKGSEKSKFKK
jgi:hypothetical protein